MISRQKYKEYISEQGELESQVAEDWGYRINPKAHVPSVIKPPQNIKVTNIEPIKQNIPIEPSAKLLRLEEQLLMMQNERKLNELTQQAKAAFERGELPQNNESAAIKMMNQCFEEYNFLLEHRHIIEKNSEKARKILGIKKTKVEVLNEQIEQLKQRLARATFTEMIEINQKIAGLYRQYEKHMLQSKETTTVKSIRGTSLGKSKIKESTSKSITLINTVKLSSDLRTSKKYSMKSSEANISRRAEKKVEMKDFVVLQELKELQQSSSGNSMEFQKSNKNWIQADVKNQPRSVFIGRGRIKMTKKGSLPQTRQRLQTVTEKFSVREQKERVNTTVTQTFLSKDTLEKGNELDDYLRQYEDVMDVWRTRIDENKEKNRVNQLKVQPKTKKFRKSLKEAKKIEEEQKQKQLKEEFEKMEKARAILAFRMEEVKKEMVVKQNIFSTLLRKKQSKYKRVPGTQIIKPYDAREDAKMYLGSGETRRGSVKQRKTVYGTSSFEKRDNKEKDVPQWLTIDPDSEQIYWSMCRNEKMNLLLKNHKKQ